MSSTDELKCNHENLDPNYYMPKTCTTPYCWGREVRCLDCGGYITTCVCGLQNNFVPVEEESTGFNEDITNFFTDLYYQEKGLYVGNGVRCFKLGIREYEKFPELSEVAEIYVWQDPSSGQIMLYSILMRDLWQKEHY